MRTARIAWMALVPVAALLIGAGCAELGSLGELDLGKMQSAGKVWDKAKEAAKDITPEQEYYIGRAVGATIMTQYKPYDQEAATRYLNVLGQALAMASDKPETFGGYHFLVLDADEVNAFAAPGGLIFVSRGMLRCCKSEDAVAAVLAHEIGHVQLEHGLNSIKKGRLTSALTVLAAESAKSFGGQELAQLTEAFEGTIGDIADTLVTSGYSRGSEREADKAAVAILKRVGYDPNALIAMLEEMKGHIKPGGPGFAKTHPAPAARIADLRKIVGAAGAGAASTGRSARLQKALGSI